MVDAPHAGLPLFEAVPGAAVALHPDDFRVLAVTDDYLQLTRWRRDELLGRPFFEVFPIAADAPADSGLAALQASLQRVRLTHRREVMPELHMPLVDAASGRRVERYWRPVNAPVLDAAGALVAIIHSTEDVTAGKRSEERLQYVTEAALDIIWDIDLVHGTCWCNDGVRKYGYDFGGQFIPMEEWLSRLHPDDRVANTPSLERALADPAARFFSIGYRFLTAAGHYVHFEDRCYILRDLQGRPVRMVGGSIDVTRRLEMEEQLLQTQRLESLGQLTGGIAHDFNNLLTVILGNAEVLQERLRGQEPLQRLVGSIETAASRSANLTRQLLAFSRKQTLRPGAHDIRLVLAGLDHMLQRTLGEHIRIELQLAASLRPAWVDAGQLEVALLNLCINARDAMPQGGTLTLRAEQVHIEPAAATAGPGPGDHVCISVSDTGTGIPAALQEHVFEPFFTTKAAGKGTGLGLSMVFGFIKQSNGHIDLRSEPGQGTCIRLWLPCAPAEALPAPPRSDHELLPRGTEAVLLVEDNGLLRRTAADLLRSLGYEVLEAAQAGEALALLQRHADIRLLFTDLMLPGRDGHALAREARALRPDLRLLFTSGHGSTGLPPDWPLRGVQLLPKPYTRQLLAASLRELLD